MFRRFLILPVVCFIAFVLSMPLAAQQAPAAQTTDTTAKATETAAATAPAAKAADKVIVTCEEIVPRSFIRLDPDQNSLPPFFVDAIVKLPRRPPHRVLRLLRL